MRKWAFWGPLGYTNGKDLDQSTLIRTIKDKDYFYTPVYSIVAGDDVREQRRLWSVCTSDHAVRPKAVLLLQFLFVCTSQKHAYIILTLLNPTFIQLVFLFLLKNIDCGYSLEPSRRGGSNEYPQSMFWAEYEKY